MLLRQIHAILSYLLLEYLQGRLGHLKMSEYRPKKSSRVEPILSAKIILGPLKTHCQMGNGDAEEDRKMQLTGCYRN